MGEGELRGLPDRHVQILGGTLRSEVGWGGGWGKKLSLLKNLYSLASTLLQKKENVNCIILINWPSKSSARFTIPEKKNRTPCSKYFKFCHPSKQSLSILNNLKTKNYWK